MFATELAKMEEGNRIRIAAANDSDNLCSEDPLCDDQLSNRDTIQQLLHGNDSFDGYPVYHRGGIIAGKYYTLASYREENYLHCVRLPDVDWSLVEYACFHDV